MLESAFKTRATKWLRDHFPGCIIMKNDAGLLLGIPDMTILYRDKWALLEFKASASSAKQPLQDDYIQLSRQWSYGSFVYPENWQQVQLDLLNHFGEN